MITSRRVTLFDIADALGISIGTVHRALHDRPGVNPITRTRVLQMSKSMGAWVIARTWPPAFSRKTRSFGCPSTP
jgi:Bacterial regulatory proteins, lacI family